MEVARQAEGVCRGNVYHEGREGHFFFGDFEAVFLDWHRVGNSQGELPGGFPVTAQRFVQDGRLGMKAEG